MTFSGAVLNAVHSDEYFGDFEVVFKGLGSTERPQSTTHHAALEHLREASAENSVPLNSGTRKALLSFVLRGFTEATHEPRNKPQV
jgi:hypothetical protein